MCYGETTFDEHSINVLVDTLNTIKKKGGRVNCDKLWAPDLQTHFRNVKLSEGIDKELTEARAALKELKGLRHILTNFSASLEGRIRRIDSDILQHCLHSLSDDVLSIIFELAHEDSSYSSKAISKVNRRFRRIALSLPKLWSVIDSTKVDEVKLFLTRSKKAPLDVRIRVWDKVSIRMDGLDVLKTFIPHERTRLQKLVIHLACPRVWKQDFAVLGALCSTLPLPKLEYVHIVYPNRNDPPYCKWRLPRTTLLHKVERAEPPGVFSHRHHPRPFDAPLLSTVEIRLRDGRHREHNMRGMFEFLAAIPRLEELVFSFISGLVDSDSLPKTELTRLKNLALEIVDMMPDNLSPVMRALTLPSLESLTAILKVRNSDTKDIDDWMECILPPRTSFHNLAEFSLKITPYTEFKLSSYYTLPFNRLPSLRHLTLITPNLQPNRVYSGSSDQFPALKTLHIRLCDRLSVQWIRSLRSALEEHGHWQAFEKLMIAGCPELDKLELSEVVPEDRVGWLKTSWRDNSDDYFVNGNRYCQLQRV